MRSLTLTVYGTPAGKGSKRGVIHKTTQKVVMMESSKKEGPWRREVRDKAREAFGNDMLLGPIHISLTFVLARPVGHWGQGRNAGQLRKSARIFPSTKPDLDKLVRSTLDGLTEAAVYEDDARVVSLKAEKVYAGLGVAPHCNIYIREAVE